MKLVGGPLDGAPQMKKAFEKWISKNACRIESLETQGKKLRLCFEVGYRAGCAKRQAKRGKGKK